MILNRQNDRRDVYTMDCSKCHCVQHFRAVDRLNAETKALDNAGWTFSRERGWRCPECSPKRRSIFQ